jgi:hypothetical protein
MLRWRVRSRRRPPERHGLGATEQHGVMRVQAKWTQRIDHCASDIDHVSEKFRRFFGSASGLAATQGTNCRPSVAVSDKGSVCADDVMRGLGTASKLNADVGFLSQLRALGRERAQAWIDHHLDDLGSRSTVDIRAAYL